MTAIDEYDDFCREYVVPQLEDDAVNGRWRGTIPSCFKVKKGVNQYIIYYDYRVENYMDLQLGLWGVLEDEHTFVINCKCFFANLAKEKEKYKQIERRIESLKETCIKEFKEMGFGFDIEKHYICVWASMDEPDEQYVVEGIDNPYSLYSTFIDVIERNVIECYAS